MNEEWKKLTEDLSTLLVDVKFAWDDFKKYGTHEGKCNFDGECPECKRPTGVCTHHGEAMKRREERMEKVVENITKIIDA